MARQFPKPLTPEMRAIYDRIGRLYKQGFSRAEIVAELGISGDTYRRAYVYLCYFKMITTRAKRSPKAETPKPPVAPRLSKLSFGRKEPKVVAAAAVKPIGPVESIDDFIARHGSHVCENRHTCKRPGVHLVTRAPGDSDFEAPVEVKQTQQNKNAAWKRALGQYEAIKNASGKRRAAE